MTATTDRTLSDDDLRALAQQHEKAARDAAAEVERRDTERAEAEATVQRERDARLVRAHRAIEDRLVAEAKAAEVAFRAAVAEGDLSAAFRAWLAQRASRPARQGLRDAIRQSEANAATGLSLVGPEVLAYDSRTFIDSVQAEGDRQASERGYEHGQRLVEQARSGWAES